MARAGEGRHQPVVIPHSISPPSLLLRSWGTLPTADISPTVGYTCENCFDPITRPGQWPNFPTERRVPFASYLRMALRRCYPLLSVLRSGQPWGEALPRTSSSCVPTHPGFNLWLPGRDYSADASNGSGSSNSAGAAGGMSRKNHWTDGKLRELLEAQNQKLWIQGVKERLKTHHLPEEAKSTVVQLLEQRFSDDLQKYQDRVMDERSSTHLQTAALALATYKVLIPYIRNEEEVLAIIKGQMGEAASPMLRYMLKGTLYFSSDPFKSMARRLHSLRSDLGAAVRAEITESEREATMDVTSCLYHNVFEAEQLPQLTSCCCCSVDSMWFEGLERFGVRFTLDKKLSDGHDHCCLHLKRIPK